MARKIEPLSKVVTEQQVRRIAQEFQTPVYVYSQRILEEQAKKALSFPHAFGLTVRYAMKANPNQNIVRLFHKKGISIDASSGFEAQRAIDAGVPPRDILLTSQEIPKNLFALVASGVNYTACSLEQLVNFAGHVRNDNRVDVSVRINPGRGSGSTKRTNTGGKSSSFGIWYEQIPEVLDLVERYGLNVTRIHTHIGSGSDPEVWKKVALMSLKNVDRFLKAGHDVQSLNLGGGYKVARMSYEKDTDLKKCGESVKRAFSDFAKKTKRKLRLEIEPGTFLVANAGAVVSKVVDVKSTPEYDFLIIDSGMTEVTRPSLYGAQHPLFVVPQDKRKNRKKEYIVSGHCCESGDILTPANGNPEKLQPRLLNEARIGDFLVVGGAGAYCAGMSTINYNSYPQAGEVLIDNHGRFQEIRKRQTLAQITQNEERVYLNS